jgi:hypothetical protein
MSHLLKLFRILWIYRPYSFKNDSKMGTRNMTIGEAKLSTLEVMCNKEQIAKNGNHLYAAIYVGLLIRALIGPIMEFVHAAVDTRNYIEILSCEGKLIFV